MKAEIITIGDEILIGQVIDTNSAWIARELNAIGVEIKHIASVSDESEPIKEALRAAEKRAKVIFITGGLGPTNDDITKKVLCEYFDCGLRFDEQAYKDVEHLFKIRGREVSPVNRKQAEIPEKSQALYNSCGTAPGMLFNENGIIYISMPGVPYEMKTMMTNHVLPMLKIKLKDNTTAICHKTLLTLGIGESVLAELIKDWENDLPSYIKLAYLPQAGMVRLRLTARGKNEANLRSEIEDQFKKVHPLIENNVFGWDEDTLPAILGKTLLNKKFTLSTAESCTGGNISHLITLIPGSSAYYLGSVIAYDYKVKTNELGVSDELLNSKGAVSEEVVRQMALAVADKLKTDCSISVSGIAGPGGGTEMKPVGTCWIAVNVRGDVEARMFRFGDNRLHNITVASNMGMFMLLRKLQKL